MPECKQANDGQQMAGKDNTANGFNDQSKNIEQQQSAISPTSSPTSSPTPGPSTLTVSKDVICNFAPSSAVECPAASEFSITATTSNGPSLTFSGSESGTPLTINPPFPVTYQVTETSPTQGFVVDTINLPAGSTPVGIAFNPHNGFIYVANQGSGTVSRIDPATNTVVGPPITVGASPFGIAYNPNNFDMYVTNQGSNTVSVIDDTTNLVTDYHTSGIHSRCYCP